MPLPPTPPPKWLVDLSTPPTAKPSRTTTYADPPGFSTLKASTSTSKSSNKSAITTPRKQPTPEQMDTLKLKKAWEIALAPAKQLPMNAIGMYMSGNSLQIFSIMMVFMLFKGPILAVLNIQGTFQRLESPGIAQQMLLVKAAFVGCNLLALALGIWKVNGMGLLPYVFFSHSYISWMMLICDDQDHKIRLAGMGVCARSSRDRRSILKMKQPKMKALMIPLHFTPQHSLLLPTSQFKSQKNSLLPQRRLIIPLALHKPQTPIQPPCSPHRLQRIQQHRRIPQSLRLLDNSPHQSLSDS